MKHIELTSIEIQDNWQSLLGKDCLSQELKSLLMYFESNQTIGNQVYAGLKRAPAGKFNHHCFEGGLVSHYLEMFEVHKLLNAVYKLYHDSDVLEAIILHDLHKGHKTFRYADINDKTKEGQWFVYGDNPITGLMGNNEQTLAMCMIADYKPSSPLIMNALLNSEGGWSKNPTKFCSSFAKYIYLLDEMSSNVLAREEKRNNVDVFSGLSINNNWISI
jgi:hypothetical protein